MINVQPFYDPRALRATVGLVSAELVTVGGYELPQSFEGVLRHPDWPVTINLQVIVDPERGPIAAGLGVHVRRWSRGSLPTDVPTYRELDLMLSRTAGLGDLLQDLTADAAAKQRRNRDGHELAADGGDRTAEEAREVLRLNEDRYREIAAAARDHAAPRRRRSVTKGHLAEVAAVYRRGLDEGHPPTRFVAEYFATSRPTAARWVRFAREAGLLGPATGTRPGEGPLDG